MDVGTETMGESRHTGAETLSMAMCLTVVERIAPDVGRIVRRASAFTWLDDEEPTPIGDRCHWTTEEGFRYPLVALVVGALANVEVTVLEILSDAEVARHVRDRGRFEALARDVAACADGLGDLMGELNQSIEAPTNDAGDAQSAD